MSHRNGLLTLAAVSLALAALVSPATARNFPTTLSENLTGMPDSRFLGAPNNVYGGLGREQLTYDFGPEVIVNRLGAVDFNVYEYVGGTPEFQSIDVLASRDGITFTSVKSSETGSVVNIAGDGVHGASNTFARSYDLGAFSWARYIRIDGLWDADPGGGNGFDLDAIGAHEVTAIPEAASVAMMLGGLVGVGLAVRLRRR